MSKILVIGDCHVEPDQSLDRFDLLPPLILETRPDHVIIIGDFLTMDSLSPWEKDKRKTLEAKRYKKDLEAGNEALDRIFDPITEFNKRQKRSKKGSYRPNVVYIEGNHEEWVTRYLDYDPTFDEMISVQKDLNLAKRGITWVPYREYYYINGIGFTHVPHNKVKPVGGVDVCRKASNCTINSVVFGHTHELNIGNNHVEGMEHLQQILNCGCYFEETPHYAKGKQTIYWDGVILLDNYKFGRFDMETFSHGRLKRLYG